jgi:hypothetical protein
MRQVSRIANGYPGLQVLSCRGAKMNRMKLFLSYTQQDRDCGSEIAGWLTENGFEVYNWLDPAVGGGQFIEKIEAALQSADAFLALLSPSYLSSRWCRQERHLAMQREQDLQKAGEPNRAFVHVLRILETPDADLGFLRNYNWTDLTSPANRATMLSSLASRLRPDSAQGAATSQAVSPQPASPKFQNREDELDKVLRGLTNAGGPHFWLVIAPPQLGKTWFLQRVSSDPALSTGVDWVIRQADLRAEPPALRSDAAALLGRLFDRTPPPGSADDVVQDIALEIRRSRKPHLCLLDGAELLDKETAVTLRSYLSQIYHLVQEPGRNGVRLALIVASRRENDWRGVTPDPRLSPLSLTEFKVDVVQQALHELSEEMELTFAAVEQRKNAALVHRLTEGLPAVLVPCLQWIQAQEWLLMNRLESQQLFEKLAAPYIRDGLLTQRSLFLEGHEPADEALSTLEQAYRILAPYRLFTQSHLRYFLKSDPAFGSALNSAQWRMEDLWKAISGTALLTRPLDEPWQEIHPAIRRLLYRYYYNSPEQRAAAHSEARKFVEIWAESQSGKEQVIGLVECLWHEAIVLRLQSSAEMRQSEMRQRLCQSAATLSRALKPSPAYTVEELRDYAADRMTSDEELQEAVSDVDSLFASLVEIVVTPPLEP